MPGRPRTNDRPASGHFAIATSIPISESSDARSSNCGLLASIALSRFQATLSGIIAEGSGNRRCVGQGAEVLPDPAPETFLSRRAIIQGRHRILGREP